VTGLPVHVYEVRESTALGACISGACGAGLYQDIEAAVQSMVHLACTYQPDSTRSKEYTAAYERWLSIHQHLTSFHMKNQPL
jgi:xylulokinase